MMRSSAFILEESKIEEKPLELVIDGLLVKKNCNNWIKRF